MAEQNDNVQNQDERAKLSTRRKILDSARVEFARHGKAGARVDRIADQALVNKAMIYYHFDSKENLYLEVVRDLFSEMTFYAERDITAEPTLELLLGVLVEIHTRLFTEVEEFKPIMFREMANPNPEVLQRIASVFAETGIPETLIRLMHEGTQRGEYRPIDPRQALVAFVTLSIGYLIMHPLVNRVLKIEDQKKFLEERKRVVVEIFLNGLKAR
jgi:TetR/AcrR family transcriptional regulator